MPSLYLLDAYALIYRAYYGLFSSPLVNSKGQNVSAVHGFVSTLWDIVQKEQPDYLGVAFDPHGPTFRHEAFPAYKAQREETPEDIRWAMPVIKSVLEAMRIPLLEVAGFEADDVIGTLALQGKEAGLEVFMVTPDKDYAQLVQDHITMLRPGHKGGFERLGPKEVCEKYALREPAQVLDLLALMGDSADNFPGCPGVGPKTAATLLQQFGNIGEMLARTSEIKGALRTKVESHVADIEMSRFLATIRTDVPLTLDLDLLRRREVDSPTLLQIFREHEFAKLSRRICGDEASVKPSADAGEEIRATLGEESRPDFKPVSVENETDRRRIIENIPTTAFVGFGLTLDCECLQDAKITAVGLALADTSSETAGNGNKSAEVSNEAAGNENKSADVSNEAAGSADASGAECWEFNVSRETSGDEDFGALFADDGEADSGEAALLSVLRPLLERSDVTLVGYGLKAALGVLAERGVEVKCKLWDVQLAYYVIDPEKNHSLKGRTGLSAGQWAAECLVRRPDLLWEMQRTGVASVFSQIEMPLLPVLAEMERHGVRLDTRALAEVGQDFRSRLADIEKDIYREVGHEFLITSPRQVGDVLFDELKLSEKARRTKNGQYSTSEETLEALRPKHRVVGLILQHRALKKLLSTYVDALPKLIHPRTGRIHTSFNQAVTATGRLSSSNPNLQNIPVRGEDGREIRRCFVAEPGQVFYSADYSQIELRIMAHLSGDEAMQADFLAGHDVHAATASRIFHCTVGEVSRDMRRKAKTANFGIIYGISAFGLAERMEVSRSEAKELIDSYFLTYPSVRQYIDRAIQTARDTGYALTLSGRRRYLKDIASRNGTVRAFAERNAVNAPIQGTAADIIKLAMIRITDRLKTEGLKARMILQVHDELNFTCPPEELDALRKLVLEEMASACTLSVPLVADDGVGRNWLEAH